MTTGLRTAVALLVSLTATTLLAGCGDAAPHVIEQFTLAPQASPAGEPATVQRVIDGDTLNVTQSGRRLTIRLIGVDTPETERPNTAVQCFGPQASARTTALAAGQQVRVQADPSQDTVDRYGRTLAYVWLPDNTMLNQRLLEEGFAREYTYRDRDCRFAAQFRSAAREAQRAGQGLWSACR